MRRRSPSLFFALLVLAFVAQVACLARSDWDARRKLQLSDCWPNCGDGNTTGGDGVPGCGGGSGTVDDPIIVCTEAQLRGLHERANLLVAAIVLNADIDLGEAATPLQPIGTRTEPFQGSFDGRGHTLSGVRLVGNAASDGVGLFGALARAVVRDLNLKNPVVSTQSSSTGVLVGLATDSTLANIQIVGPSAESHATLTMRAVEGGSIEDVGGLAGRLEGTLVSDCKVEVDILAEGSGYGAVGGFVGATDHAAVARSSSRGNVTVPGGNYVGGMVGYCSSIPSTVMYLTATFSESQATGAVVGGTEVGGFGGFMINFCHVENSFASGAVTGTTRVGGFAGTVASLPHVINVLVRQPVTGTSVTGRFAGSHFPSYDFNVAGTFVGSDPTPALPLLGEGTVSTGLHALSDSQFAGNESFVAEAWPVGRIWYRDAAAPALLALAAHGDPCAQHTGATAHNEIGAGTEADPYQLCTVAQLRSLSQASAAADWGKFYVLLRDLDLGGIDWMPIGDATTPFVGNFDGRYHQIANLTVTRTDSNDAGFFGVVGAGALVMRLRFRAPRIVGPYQHAGVLAGQLLGVAAYVNVFGADTSATGVESTSAAAQGVGGLVGAASGAGVLGMEFVYVEARVLAASGYAAVGGLVGLMSATGNLMAGVVRGSVQGDLGPVGGVVGQLTQTSLGGLGFRGDVVGHADVGGLVGRIDNSSLFSAIAYGTITGTAAVGGLVGAQVGATLSGVLGASTLVGGSSQGALVGANDAVSTITQAVWLADSNPMLSVSCGDTECPAATRLSAAAFTDPASYASWTNIVGTTPFQTRSSDAFALIPGQMPWLRFEREFCFAP